MRKGFGILLVSTGPFANATLEYATRLLGATEGCTALELDEGEHWEEALSHVQQALEKFSQYRGVLVLVELMGGTPYNISKALAKDHNVEIIGGVNLPVVIKAMQMMKDGNLKEAAHYLEAYGRDHVLRCEGV